MLVYYIHDMICSMTMQRISFSILFYQTLKFAKLIASCASVIWFFVTLASFSYPAINILSNFRIKIVPSIVCTLRLNTSLFVNRLLILVNHNFVTLLHIWYMSSKEQQHHGHIFFKYSTMQLFWVDLIQFTVIIIYLWGP